MERDKTVCEKSDKAKLGYSGPEVGHLVSFEGGLKGVGVKINFGRDGLVIDLFRQVGPTLIT